MTNIKKFKKKPDQIVVAVRVDLDTPGFDYQKWGAKQRCAAGDWLVFNAGDTYTVANDSFSRSYESVAPGQYVKTAPVWARVATDDGLIETNEGQTEYRRGDYIVFNNADETDGYAISAEKFLSMYEPND